MAARNRTATKKRKARPEPASNLETLREAHARLSDELSSLECIRRALTHEETAGDCESALRLILHRMHDTYDLFDEAIP